ncbi:MAG: HTTM domain-containing protein [Cyclobacteriaceae bacterium]
MLALLAGMVYVFFLREWVNLAYEGEAPAWFQGLIDQLYPRFAVEKQRFELAFFLQKADQIIIRLLLFTSVISWLLWINLSAVRINRLSPLKTNIFYTGLRLVFYLGLLYFSWHWYEDFPRLVRIEAFYKPTYLLQLMGLPILSLEIFYLLFAVYFICLLMVLLGQGKVAFSLITAALLIFFQAYFYSFEKVEHSYSTMNYVALMMPALFYELSRQKGQKQKRSWVLFLMQATVAGIYFLAGMEKLLSSGLDWATAETFRTYIMLHDQEPGLWVAKSDFLSHLLPWTALLIQLGFPLILFFPRYKYLILLLGVSFHLGTRLLFGIGPYFSSWLLAYAVFIDWDLLSLKIRDLIADRQIRAKKGA